MPITAIIVHSVSWQKPQWFRILTSKYETTPFSGIRNQLHARFNFFFVIRLNLPVFTRHNFLPKGCTVAVLGPATNGSLSIIFNCQQLHWSFTNNPPRKRKLAPGSGHSHSAQLNLEFRHHLQLPHLFFTGFRFDIFCSPAWTFSIVAVPYLSIGSFRYFRKRTFTSTNQTKGLLFLSGYPPLTIAAFILYRFSFWHFLLSSFPSVPANCISLRYQSFKFLAI